MVVTVRQTRETGRESGSLEYKQSKAVQEQKQSSSPVCVYRGTSWQIHRHIHRHRHTHTRAPSLCNLGAIYRGRSYIPRLAAIPKRMEGSEPRSLLQSVALLCCGWYRATSALCCTSEVVRRELATGREGAGGFPGLLLKEG